MRNKFSIFDMITEPILFYFVQWLLFCRDWTSARPVVGTISRSAADKEFSSVVAIGYKNRRRSKGPQFCSGTLITRRHVLTAAHCIESLNKANVQVFGGSHHIEKCDAYNIESWITYSQWAKENNVIQETIDDLAIITLKGHTDEEKMKPALISFEASEKHEGLNVEIAGWGIMNDNSRPVVLQTAPVKILKLEESERRWPYYEGWHEHMHKLFMCTGAKQHIFNLFPCKKKWASTSPGDSGGAVLYKKNVLVAVVKGHFPLNVNPKESMNVHVGLDKYKDFFKHLENEGLRYIQIHK